jgi:hypothetical protein
MRGSNDVIPRLQFFSYQASRCDAILHCANVRALKRPATLSGRSATDIPLRPESNTLFLAAKRPISPPYQIEHSRLVASRPNECSRGFQPTDTRPTQVPRRVATLEVDADPGAVSQKSQCPDFNTPGPHQWIAPQPDTPPPSQRDRIECSRGFQPTDTRPTPVPRRIATLEVNAIPAR